MLLRLAGVICLVAASAAILRAVHETQTAEAMSATTNEARRAPAANDSRTLPGAPLASVVPRAEESPGARMTVSADAPAETKARRFPRTSPHDEPASFDANARTAARSPASSLVPDRRQPEFVATPAGRTSAWSDGAFLPVAAQTVAHVETPAAEPSRLVFAAGAVELKLPEGWFVYEAPTGREVRVVLSPEPLDRPGEMPSDGMWFAFHPRPPRGGAAVDLEQVLAERLRLATDNRAQAAPPETLTLDRRRALRRRFDMAPGPAAAPLQRGFHLLIDTEWGLCEVHGVAPSAQYERRSSQFQRVIDSVRLARPRPKQQVVADHLHDAAPIIGAWKALASRLRLHGDGRIEIVLDNPQRADNRSDTRRPPRPRRLVGRFTAEQDLLRVTWSDGSLLNFRWRLQGNDLLLTDHEGRVSQLSRLLE